MERGSSAVECCRPTRNQASPGSNPPLLPFEDWAFSFSPLIWAAVFTFNPYLLISINELMISIIHLLISINKLLISIN